MRVFIKSTNLSLTEAIEDYIQKKIGGLEKYLKRLDSPAVEMRVEIGRTTEHHKKGNIFRAEANLKLPGHLLRAVEESDDVYTALDLIHEELKRQIVSFKEKKISKRLRSARVNNIRISR